MSIIDAFLCLHSRPDGTSVSRPELDRLRQQERIAELIAHRTPPHEQDGKHLEEQQCEGRMRHIAWRLEHARGRAAGAFSNSAMRDAAKDDPDRSR